MPGAKAHDHGLDEWPDPIWTKAQFKDWYSDASPGQQAAVNRAAAEFRRWQTSSQNAWFGVALNPAEIEAECRALAAKYGCPLAPLSYNSDP